MAEIFYIWLNVELFWVTKSFCVDSVLEIVLFRFQYSSMYYFIDLYFVASYFPGYKDM